MDWALCLASTSPLVPVPCPVFWTLLVFNGAFLAHGRIRLKFDARALLDGSLASPHDSAPKQIGDVQWSIIAQRKPVRRDENVYALGFFLKCHGVPTDPQWRRGVHMLMRVVAQAPGADDLRKTAAHTFYSREDDWGFCQFAPFDVSLYWSYPLVSGTECKINPESGKADG